MIGAPIGDHVLGGDIAESDAICRSRPQPGVHGLTVAAIACYAATLAPITWVLIAEVFPNKSRAHGVSAAVSALWIASFLLTYSFPLMNQALGTGGVFVSYGVICLLGFAFVYLRVPETKGMRLEDM